MFTRRGPALFAFLAAVCLLLATPAFADSEARIVRLSYIDGDVQIDRNIGQGFEQAILNMPVVQGTRIYTGNDGRVEIEFENGSTVRLTGPCDLLVRQLTLRASGDRVSVIDLREGLAYFDVNRKGDEEFRVVVGSQQLNLKKSAHFRLRVDRDDVQLAVMKGEVSYEAGSRDLTVRKNESLALDLRDPERYFLAKNIDEYDSDQWDAARDQYRDQYETADKYRNKSPYAWGWSDLDYYGSYFSAPGYGWVWRPYGASIGWDPFGYGAWSWYPGFGWTYVSAYPWGWVPYRYGSWLYLANYGWCWQASDSWNYWNTVPVVLHPPQHYVIPRAPAGPRRGGTIVTGLSNPPRLPAPNTRPAPPGGVPAPIARTGRVVVNNDVDRPIKGRPSAMDPIVSGRSGVPSGAGRQPVEIQRPNAETQIPSSSIRVTPTDMRPPQTAEKPTSGADREPTGRSSVFDRPRDEGSDRPSRDDSRVVPGPVRSREVPSSSAPVTSTSPPRASAPVSDMPSRSSAERSVPSPRSETPVPSHPAPSPRSEMPSPSHSTPAPVHVSPPPAPSPPPSAPAAPVHVPAPSRKGR